jgi:outer membrane translocation and assembly module TamA
MARHTLASWLQLQYGPLLQYFKISEAKNSDHYITDLPPYEIETSAYGNKWYVGAEAGMMINTRNNELIPTRGFHINVYTRPMTGIGDNTGKLNQSGGDLSFYSDFLFKKHIIIASSFGISHNFGNFEIPQAQYLGFKQNLRGYRYQRFAGRTRVYNNTDLRINFGEVNFYLFKGPLGVLAFHDIGRVWADKKSSDVWHKGYGGGIWLAPFSKVVLTALLTYSKEEKAFPMVTFGFQF